MPDNSKPNASGSGNLRVVDVVDLVIADGKYYKPAIMRSYARFSYMPDGKTVLDTIRSIEEGDNRRTTRIVALEEWVGQEYAQTISALQNKIDTLEARIAALEAKK